MKSLRKTLFVGSLLALSGIAQADVSANIGYASEYFYRGFFQETSSASAGIDYEGGGFYAGAWAADVGEGAEVDLYAGFGGEIGDFGYSIGVTGYYYPSDFDDTYQEINLGASYGMFSLDVAVGQYDAPPSDAVCTPAVPVTCSPSKSDYTFYSLTWAGESGLYATVAAFGQDFEGEYLELGYGTTVSDIDLGVALIFPSSEITDVNDASDENIVFTIGKSFDL